MFRTGLSPAGFPMIRSAARMGVLGLAAVLVLGGCTGSNDDPHADAAEGTSRSAAPTSSASAAGDATESASDSSTPTPPSTAAAYKPATAEGPAENVPLPVMPELAKQESKEGLEAFAEYWYSLVNYGYETGDPEPLKKITGPSCSICENYYSSLQSGYDDQDWMAGSSVRARSVHSDFILTPDGYYQVLIQITQEDLEYFGPNGVDYGIVEGIYAPIVQIIEASHDGSSWRAMLVESIK
ncbi:DUF6318 family protein [Arthrobacter citreus]|uniref:DUF6318 family protein n=1 Tax=Arthrobacter citreus TaxID=1670 RepID=A0ABZ2ZSI3_9MICC